MRLVVSGLQMNQMGAEGWTRTVGSFLRRSGVNNVRGGSWSMSNDYNTDTVTLRAWFDSSTWTGRGE